MNGKNILVWTDGEGGGPFQKQLPDGRIYGDLLTVKPDLSFPYTDLHYSEPVGIFTVDGMTMTDAQRAEVLNRINGIRPPIEWFKAMKHGEIGQAYARELQPIVGSVDQFEMAAWPTMEAEARAVMADPSARSDFLDGVRAARGKNESKVAHAQRVVKQFDDLRAAYGPLLGKMQAKREAVEAATTPEQVDAISWL